LSEPINLRKQKDAIMN